jgi:hypothetical protein
MFVEVLTKPPKGQTHQNQGQSMSSAISYPMLSLNTHFDTFFSDIHINIQASNRRLSDDDFIVFLAWLEKNALPQLFGGEIPSTNGAKRRRMIIRQFQIQDNNLGDQAITALAEFLLSLDHAITVRTLKCWNNKIGDAGCISLARLITRSKAPPLLEIHLSHNRITSRGAVELLKVVAESTAWPIPPKDPESKAAHQLGPIPLWLRLEHNFIFAQECLDILRKQKVQFCAFNTKAEGGCNNSHCAKSHDTKFHLAFFEFQYFHSSLAAAKEATMTSKLEMRLSSLSLAEQSEEISGEHSSQVISPVPLFIFMDTNAVVRCVNEKDKPLSFGNIRTRFQSGQFSVNDQKNAVERVFLVLTDTVLGFVEFIHSSFIWPLPPNVLTGFYFIFTES